MEVTGTSYSTPQVAAAAYLASRLYHVKKPSSPFTKYEFFACIMYSSENDPEGRTAPDKIYWEEVGEPQYNLGEYTIFYSYRVGYGSLDVYDMLEYVADLS
ncbi:MAG: hypothetical protein ACTSPF_13160 [Candidatus Heimdallarchaeaceae archaeon]